MVRINNHNEKKNLVLVEQKKVQVCNEKKEQDWKKNGNNTKKNEIGRN